MPPTGEDLFWDLAAQFDPDPRVQRSTMMGRPCLRFDGAFFASFEHRSGALLVKLPAARVADLIAAGRGEAFAPAGRVFREWVAVGVPDRRRWRTLMTEARDHAGAQADPPVPAFTGFSTAALDFLAGLDRDNSKRYFDAHRDVYRKEVLEPAKDLVVALGARLRDQTTAGLRAEPRVGGSIFRIANDLRFAPGKPPYKPHLDLAFWVGPSGPRVDPSLILRIAPGAITTGVGAMPRTGPALAAYRQALAGHGADLARQVADLPGGELSEPTRKRLPPGFDPADPAAPFALRDGWHLVHHHPVPAVIDRPGFVDWCAHRFAPFGPVFGWLTRVGG